MAKFVVRGNQLINPRVEWISLVERGANRAPFKLVKNHKGESRSEEFFASDEGVAVVKKIAAIEDDNARADAAAAVIAAVHGWPTQQPAPVQKAFNPNQPRTSTGQWRTTDPATRRDELRRAFALGAYRRLRPMR